MASIKDSFDETFHDNGAMLKFILLAIPTFFIANNWTKQFFGFNTLLIFTFFLLFGFMLKCTFNVRHGSDSCLPSYNIFAILWAGVKGSLALAPIGLAMYFLSKFLIGLAAGYIQYEQMMNVVTYIIYAICGSFVLTSYVLYANRFRILDAYNLKDLFTYCIDILIAIIFMLIQVAIVDAILIVPVTYVIWVFFGLPHPIALFFWSVVLAITLAMMGHYLAQIGFEIIEANEEVRNSKN